MPGDESLGKQAKKLVKKFKKLLATEKKSPSEEEVHKEKEKKFPSEEEVHKEKVKKVLTLVQCLFWSFCWCWPSVGLNGGLDLGPVVALS